MSSSCVVCSVQTTKYRCPQCMLRYCSLACCKTHKESCVKPTNDPKADVTTQVITQVTTQVITQAPQLKGQDFFARERELLIQSKVNEDEEHDCVPDELLQQLEHSSELKEILGNPHLRALLENLVKSDKPETAMAEAMREPIFTEFADACLQIVDKSNPNMEHVPDVST